MKKTFLFLVILPLILTGCLSQPATTGASPGSGATKTSLPAQTPAFSLPATSSQRLTTKTSQQTAGQLVLLPPVETGPANTSYKPYFTGQTRIDGTRTQASIQVKIITKDLASPWSIASLPDGRLIITEKAGFLRILAADDQLGPKIGGLPPVDDRNQGGLLDVAPAPDFAQSRLLFLTLAEKTSQGSATAVARGRLAEKEDQLEDVKIIWRALPYYDNSMHFGSRLAFDQEGFIFVSTGERSDLATRPLAQDLGSGYGKIVRLSQDGQPAPGNPFAGQAGALAEIYSYGHRNSQGLALHPQTGQLWQSEMGPRGGDELNLIKPGANYGWPVISYGIEYSGKPLKGGLTAQEGMEQPVYYWDPVLAPSGMTFYNGKAIPEWEDNLFIAGLAAQHIARLVIQKDRVVAEERLLASEGQRFRDITTGPDGALYAVTDAGRLYKIAPN